MLRFITTALRLIRGQACFRVWDELRRDQRGAAMWLMVTGLIPAIGLIGSAIDIGRVYMVKTQLQAGVDAAALASARNFSVSGSEPNSRENQARAYFNGNVPPGFMGVTTAHPRSQIPDRQRRQRHDDHREHHGADDLHEGLRLFGDAGDGGRQGAAPAPPGSRSWWCSTTPVR